MLLLTGRVAAAQQSPSPSVREQQHRQVIVPSGAQEPVPEVRVAAGVATYFRFNDAIDKASVELEGEPARFRWVDKGERLVAIELLTDLEAEEKLVLRVRYKGGVSPIHATFALVTHPTLVDKEVEVVRRPRTVEALEAELAALRAASGPAGLVFSGRIDRHGVRVQRIEMVPDDAQNGLKVMDCEGYRAGSWALVLVRVRNLPGQKPWVPGEARLTHARDGKRVKVLSVELSKNEARLAPGEEGLVAVETEAPFWKTDDVLRLELLDKRGGRLLIPNVKL